MTENERIRYLRKDVLGLTLDKFSKALGVSKSAISDIESGRNALSNQMVMLLRQIYNVNEEWLKNGIGEMYHTQTDEEKAGAILDDVTNQSPDSDKFEMYELLSKIDDPELIYELKIIADAIVRISKKTTH